MKLATAYLCMEEECGEIQKGAAQGKCRKCGSQNVKALSWLLRDAEERELWQNPATRQEWRNEFGDRQ